MKKALSIGFRVDAGRKLGLGHLSRCRSLMQAFSRLGSCQFSVVTNNREVVRKFISGFDLDIYDRQSSLAGKYFDIGIVDVPGIADRKKEKFKEVVGLIAAIDDGGPGIPGQDILIRPNLLDLPRPAKVSEKNYWSGRERIILHPDFAVQAMRKKSVNGKLRKLLVCFGGSDQCGLTLRVVPFLKKILSGVKVHIVLGVSFPWKREVVAATRRDPRFLLSYNVPNMAQGLREADAALISGGTLLYEVCALGVPSLVLSQNASQDVEARICATAGGVLNLGVNRAVSDDAISAALERIVKDASLRMRMATKGPRIVAKDGARRIALKLLSCMKERSGQ